MKAKKLLSAALAVGMTVSLAACGGGTEDSAKDGAKDSGSGDGKIVAKNLRGEALYERVAELLAQ